MDFLLAGGFLNLTYSTISGLIVSHGYLAILFLMTLESASFPVPSEVVLPAVGFFAAEGSINPILGFLAALLGGVIGMGIDYYIAYFLGKDVVYKHLHFFHISRERLLAFDGWFKENGDFAVFVSRMIPVVRGIMSFPAGFAEMPINKFMTYSVAGTILWDAVLVGFGYYVHAAKDVTLITAAFVAFAIVLCAVYLVAMKGIGKKRR